MTSFKNIFLKIRENNFFEAFVISVILISAIAVGFRTYEETFNPEIYLYLSYLDYFITTVFLVEIIIRLVAEDKTLNFFKDPWNLFDFFVISISLAPISEGFSVLRALRILRVLRALSFAPRLRRTIEGFVSALPGMSSVIILMAIIFYIGAVIATKLFASEFPIWFGSIGKSLYSLFQIMTLESWSMGIVRPVMEVYPYAWMFFVPFILITSFAVVNVLVGLIVNSMHDAHSEEATEATDAYRDDVINQLKEISKRLDKLER